MEGQAVEISRLEYAEYIKLQYQREFLAKKVDKGYVSREEICEIFGWKLPKVKFDEGYQE